MEAKLQGEIIKWLRINSVYVIKTRPGAGTPVGCPDIIGVLRTHWLAMEVKASLTAKFQVGQKLTLQNLKKDNKWVYMVCPENWPLVKEDLLASFF